MFHSKKFEGKKERGKENKEISKLEVCYGGY